MINIANLKRKTKADDYIGARIDVETKLNLDNYCKNESLAVSTLIVALIKAFLKTKGYGTKNDENTDT